MPEHCAVLRPTEVSMQIKSTLYMYYLGLQLASDLGNISGPTPYCLGGLLALGIPGLSVGQYIITWECL